MKVNLSLLGIAISLLLGGCASQMITIPVRTYSFEQQDSSIIKNHSINIDSLRILLVNRVDPSTKSDLAVKQTESGVTVMVAPYVSSGMTSSSAEGVTHNQFMDVSVMKATQRLQEITDVWLIQNINEEMSSNQLDSIVRELNIDLVIAADSITYGVRSYGVFSDHPVDAYVQSKTNRSYSYSQSEISRGMCVPYKSHWELLWIDPQTKAIKRKQRIVQTGQFYSTTGGKSWMGEVFSCSLRVGDDFVKIFQ